jgi:hypothetical protein
MLNGIRVMQTAMIVLLGGMVVTCLAKHTFGGELLDKVTGKVKVQNQTLKAEQPTKVPETVYIQDFDLDS